MSKRKNNIAEVQTAKVIAEVQTAKVIAEVQTAKVIAEVQTAKVKLTTKLEANVSEAATQALRETLARISTRQAISDFEKLAALACVNVETMSIASYTLSALIMLCNNTMRFEAHKSNATFSNASHLDLQRALHRERAARLNKNVFRSCDALLYQNVDTTNISKCRLLDVRVAQSAVSVLREYRDEVSVHNAK